MSERGSGSLTGHFLGPHTATAGSPWEGEKGGEGAEKGREKGGSGPAVAPLEGGAGSGFGLQMRSPSGPERAG